MAKQLEQLYEYPDAYTTMQRNENMYELGEIYKREESKSQESLLSTPGPAPPNVAMEPKQRQSSWSKPLLLMTVLLCLILILLIIILGIVVQDKYATGNNVECTNTATGASSSSNTNEWADRITQNISSQKLNNIVNTLSNLQDTSTSTAGVVDDLLLIAQELLVLHNDSTALPTSCKHLQEQQPNSPSGYYILAGPTGTYSTYCNMGTLCGSGGGWTRLAYLDMSDDTQNCPSGFREYQENNVTACGRLVTNSGSCALVQFPSNGISYSQICGRVTGYQYGSPDAVRPDNTNIDSPYVDGVSITRGSPRKHVWSLMSASSDSDGVCPCSSSSNVQVQSFIGDDYFCESGNNASSASATLYTSDPLWDGQGCGGSEGPCCNATGIPWFHRDYGSTTTTDYIELRVCAGEETSDEDTPVSYYEIYVK